MAHRWLTPDSLGALNCAPVYYPAGEDSLAALRGALLLLTHSWYWEKHGAQTPEDTAAAWLDAFWLFNSGGKCVHVGTVFWFAGPTTPVNCLACDGQQYQQSDYPELYATIGAVFGSSDSGWFRVPSIAGRSIFGGGTSPEGTTRTLADVGGTETVTLVEGELPVHRHSIPSHDHSVHTHLSALALAPGELPVTTPSIIPGNTGSWSGDTGNTGGGNEHENMPPFIVLNAFIQAK